MTTKLSDFQTQVFEKHHDAMGYKISSEFLNFLHKYVSLTFDPLYSFELSQDDPNYQAYIEGFEHEGSVKYYVLQAEKLKAEEKVTMFIDFSHLLQFRFNDQNFITSVVNQYHRYEVYMRKAVTQFMTDLGH